MVVDILVPVDVPQAGALGAREGNDGIGFAIERSETAGNEPTVVGKKLI